MKLLAFAASLRRESLNRKLIRLAVDLVREAKVGVAQEMARRIQAADGLMIASPEYNYSIPGTLKNAIDWVSRMKPMPLLGKHGFLMAASSSLVGGIRGLWVLRVPLEGLGVFLHPSMFALAQANQALDEQGKLKDPEVQDRLKKMVSGYLELGRKLTPE